MSDVFISYANQDRARAQMLAKALEARGLSVWWDREIVAGEIYDEVIEHELESAKSVVVLWSKHSVLSEWVKNEAAEAVQHGTLVPARIDDVKAPLEFRRKQTVDLVDWNGDPEHTGFAALWRGVSATIARQLPPRPAVSQPIETKPPSPSDAIRTTENASTLSKPGARRVVFFWAGVGLLIVAAFGIWYWDAFYRLHTDHYANVITRWGLPEGVGRLTDEQVRHRNASLAFVKRGRYGSVTEIRAVNSRGAYPPEFAYVPPMSLIGLNPLPSGESELLSLCRVTFAYDANGDILRQSAYDRSDRLLYALHYVERDIAEYKEGAFSKAVRESGITHIKIARPPTGPDVGLDKELIFLDSSGARRPNRDGTYGARRTFSALGVAVETILLGADGEPVANRVGIAKGVTEHDSQGNVTRSLDLGVQGQLAPGSDAVAETKVRYDQHGNVTETAFFGTDGQLTTLKKLGAAGRTNAYDERGNIIDVSFFGPDRQLVRSVAGFARQKVVWLEQGGTLETFFAPDGKPVPVQGKVIKLRGTYDKRGYIVGFAGFDENDHSVQDQAGCAKQVMNRDHAGNVTDLSCFNQDGRPVRNTAGFARRKAIYDEMGRMVEASFFAPQGQPEFYEESYVKTRWKYNPQGKEIEEAHFDAADRPIRNRDGYAKVTFGYDLQGKMIEVSFFDENGRPALRKGGYAKIARAYDARGNMIEETDLDTQGKPVQCDDGYAQSKHSYDGRGFRIETAYYDERDRATLHKEGCATVRMKYSDKGQWLEWACIGLDGLSAANKKNGSAKVRRTFDAQGNVSRGDYFDENDRLTRNAYGYATVTYFYDGMGRENKREFFDTNGIPVPTRVGIDKVEAGSKSERSGLRVGDLILAYDGQEVADVRMFDDFELMRGERPRQLTIQRDGKVLSIDVTAGRLTEVEVVDRSALGSKYAPKSAAP